VCSSDLIRAAKFILSTALVASLATLTACSSTGSSTSTPTQLEENGKVIKIRKNFTRTGEVHLFRGLANVFSDGINVIGDRMVRNGINARTYNHSRWRAITDDIIARSKRIGGVSYPIVIMGHSLGGNASVQMAKYLGDRGIKVAKVVSFDPTITTFVGPNIGNVRNYYIPKKDDENAVRQAAGYTGRLENVDMTVRAGVDHFNIEKQPDIQRKLVLETLALTKKRFFETNVSTDK